MPTASYQGGTSWITTNLEEGVDSRGIDALSVTRKGRPSGLAAETATWTRGKVGTSLGYPNMYLQSKRTNPGYGTNWASITLEFMGFVGTSLVNPIQTSDSISLQAATLLSSQNGDDGNPTNVQVKFYAQTTTVRWIYSGTSAPTTPRYPAVVPSTLDASTLFSPYPANYNGTLLYQVVGRLIAFEREELATNAWLVTESWMNNVEPSE